MITIEKGIPMPKQTRTSKYPFNEMVVGDSFLLECLPTAPSLARLRNACAAYRKRDGKAETKFAVRAVEDGIRVWRTA